MLRLSRIKRAVAQIDKQTQGSIQIDLNEVAADIASAPDCPNKTLDDEDLLIRQLLLKGVAAKAIVNGNYNPHGDADSVKAELEEVARSSADNGEFANGDTELNDLDISEEELARYVRSDAEVLSLFLFLFVQLSFLLRSWQSLSFFSI